MCWITEGERVGDYRGDLFSLCMVYIYRRELGIIGKICIIYIYGMCIEEYEDM